MTDKLEQAANHDFLVEIADYPTLTDRNPAEEGLVETKPTVTPAGVADGASTLSRAGASIGADALPKLPSIAYRSYRNKFVVAVIAQLLLLTGLASAHAFTVLTGTEVVLRAHPVDPWDIFRGSYEVLTYDISEVPVSFEKIMPVGKEVFVVLRKTDNTWRVHRLCESKPQLHSGEICLNGRVTQRNADSVRLRYGIEQYYEPQGSASLIDRNGSDVVVAVDAFGNAAIKRIQSRTAKP